MSYICEWCSEPATLLVRPVDTHPQFTDASDGALACEAHAACVLEDPEGLVEASHGKEPADAS